jgi:hypothetical protein
MEHKGNIRRLKKKEWVYPPKIAKGRFVVLKRFEGVSGTGGSYFKLTLVFKGCWFVVDVL